MLSYIKALGIGIVAVFLPIKAALSAVAVLVVLDMIVGMWAAHKRGEPITSAEMRRSVSKVILYELALVVAFIAEKYLIGDLMPITKIVSAMLGAVELKSIYENMSTITGEDIFKSLVAKIGSANQDQLK